MTKPANPATPRDVGRVGLLRQMLLAAALCSLLTIPVAWNARERISSDGLAYLEVALNAIRLGPQYLFSNAYWSPVYPGLLAVALKLTHPSPASELVVVHSVDWIVCLGTYLAFTWFFLNLLKSLQLTRDNMPGGAPAFRALLFFSYACLWTANLDGSLWYVGPHILTEGAVFLAAGFCLRLSLRDARLPHWVAFGMILAFGYASKAVLFPLALILLAIIFFKPGAGSAWRKGVIAAAISLLLGAAPLVAYLSYTKGRLTFGDSGRLNYAWFVNNIPHSILWGIHAPPPGTVLLHPPQRILSNPAIVRFEGPGQVRSAYPFWYDPSWWYDGLNSHFDLKQEVQQLRRSFGLAPKIMASGTNIRQMAGRWFPMLAALAAFILLGLRPRNFYDALRGHLWLILWPFFAFSLFACVLLQYRYIMPFVVLGWTVLFAVAWKIIGQRLWIGITVAATGWLLLTYCSDFAREVVHNQRQLASFNNAAAAKKLAALGIRPGDELASVDFAEETYYARLAGASFTQEIRTDDMAALSKLPAERVTEILATLRAHGAKALFSSWRPAFDNDSGWVLVWQHTYARMLR